MRVRDAPVPVMTGTQSYLYPINIPPINELVGYPASLLTQSDWVPRKDWVTGRTGTQSYWTGASLHYTHAFCIFGLMMMPDASKALDGMFRVLGLSGTIGITTWHKVGWLPFFPSVSHVQRRLLTGKKRLPHLH